GAALRRGVAVRLVVAAPEVPARQADAQVQPFAAGREAVLAAVDGRRELGDRDLVEVGAAGHGAFRSGGSGGRLSPGLFYGKTDGERGRAGPRLDRQRAVVAVHDDPPRGGEPEPGAPADVLGGEEGVEQPLARAGGDARAVVGDHDLRAVAVAPRAHG